MIQENNTPNYYSITPANVRYDKGLTANAKLLYGEITALCNQEGYCWASNRYFAELYDSSERTIIRWIQNLEKKGHIKIKYIYKDNSKEIQKRLIYIASKDFPSNVTTCTDKNVIDGGDKNVTDNTTSLDVINNSFSSSNNPKKEEKTKILDKLNENSSFEAFIDPIKEHFDLKGYKSNVEHFMLYHKENIYEIFKRLAYFALKWEDKFCEISTLSQNDTKKDNGSNNLQGDGKKLSHNDTLLKDNPKIDNKNPKWLKFTEILKKEFDANIWDKWLSKLNFVYLKDGELLLATPSKFFRDWIKREYVVKMKLNNMLGVKFVKVESVELLGIKDE